jgi:hypothetical protein
VRLIDEYFGDRRVEPATAWMDVYRLLLWVDSTTGLAHCYESDKAQPGRPWYARSLAFHAWLAQQFDVEPIKLAKIIDWMFRAATAQDAEAAMERRERQAARAHEQLDRYGSTMPAPGDDPELRQIIEVLLPSDEQSRPPDDLIRDALREVRSHIALENKRKNLLGRGFEDVLAGVISRLPSRPPALGTQTPLTEIPGFRPPRAGDKAEKVDLWVGDRARRRVLVSAKWSVRADREKQMRNDFLTYIAANELREPFEYVWITNEFDPARLVANATNTEGNSYLFTSVVHVCPAALRVVHDLDAGIGTRTLEQLHTLLDSSRIIGLDDWLKGLGGAM